MWCSGLGVGDDVSPLPCRGMGSDEAKSSELGPTAPRRLNAGRSIPFIPFIPIQRAECHLATKMRQRDSMLPPIGSTFTMRRETSILFYHIRIGNPPRLRLLSLKPLKGERAGDVWESYYTVRGVETVESFQGIVPCSMASEVDERAPSMRFIANHQFS